MTCIACYVWEIFSLILEEASQLASILHLNVNLVLKLFLRIYHVSGLYH